MIKRRFWSYEDGKLRRSPITKPIKNILINQERISYVSDLPDNCGFIINGNGDYVFEKWPLPPNHHKSDSENFTADTGIHFKIIDNYFHENPIKVRSTSSAIVKETKKTKDKVFNETDVIHKNDGTKASKIYDDFLVKYDDKTEEGIYLRSIQRTSFPKIYRKFLLDNAKKDEN